MKDALAEYVFKSLERFPEAKKLSAEDLRGMLDSTFSALRDKVRELRWLLLAHSPCLFVAGCACQAVELEPDRLRCLRLGRLVLQNVPRTGHGQAGASSLVHSNRAVWWQLQCVISLLRLQLVCTRLPNGRSSSSSERLSAEL